MAETETIYARVPLDLREAINARAAEKGMTIAHTVADLVARGLTAGNIELDMVTMLLRIMQIQREGPPASLVWERIITCDIPRLSTYLPPELLQLIEAVS